MKQPMKIQPMYYPTAELTAEKIIETAASFQQFFEVSADQFDAVILLCKRSPNCLFIRQGVFTYNQVFHFVNLHKVDLICMKHGNIICTVDGYSVCAVMIYCYCLWNNEEELSAIHHAMRIASSMYGKGFIKNIVVDRYNYYSTIPDEVLQEVPELIDNEPNESINQLVNSCYTYIINNKAQLKNKWLYEKSTVKKMHMTGILTKKEIERIIQKKLNASELITTRKVYIYSSVGASIGLVIGALLFGFLLPVLVGFNYAIGALVGLIIGWNSSMICVKKMYGRLVEDELLKMLELFHERLLICSFRQMLNKNELLQLMEIFTAQHQLKNYLNLMRAQDHRANFADHMLFKLTEPIIAQRPTVYVPKADDIFSWLQSIK